MHFLPLSQSPVHACLYGRAMELPSLPAQLHLNFLQIWLKLPTLSYAWHKKAYLSQWDLRIRTAGQFSGISSSKNEIYLLNTSISIVCVRALKLICCRSCLHIRSSRKEKQSIANTVAVAVAVLASLACRCAIRNSLHCTCQQSVIALIFITVRRPSIWQSCVWRCAWYSTAACIRFGRQYFIRLFTFSLFHSSGFCWLCDPPVCQISTYP